MESERTVLIANKGRFTGHVLLLFFVGMPVMGQTQSASNKAAEVAKESNAFIVSRQDAVYPGTWRVYGPTESLIASCDSVTSTSNAKIVSLQNCKLTKGKTLDDLLLAVEQIVRQRR